LISLGKRCLLVRIRRAQLEVRQRQLLAALERFVAGFPRRAVLNRRRVALSRCIRPALVVDLRRVEQQRLIDAYDPLEVEHAERGDQREVEATVALVTFRCLIVAHQSAAVFTRCHVLCCYGEEEVCPRALELAHQELWRFSAALMALPAIGRRVLELLVVLELDARPVALDRFGVERAVRATVTGLVAGLLERKQVEREPSVVARARRELHALHAALKRSDHVLSEQDHARIERRYEVARECRRVAEHRDVPLRVELALRVERAGIKGARVDIEQLEQLVERADRGRCLAAENVADGIRSGALAETRLGIRGR
jgi:hypothetical protein